MSLAAFTASTEFTNNNFDKQSADKTAEYASASLEDSTITFRAKPSRYGISAKEFPTNTAYSIGVSFTAEDRAGLEHVIAAANAATPQGYAFKAPMIGEYLYLPCKVDKDSKDKFDFASNVKGLKPSDLSGSKKKKELTFVGDFWLFINIKTLGTRLMFSADRMDFK